MKKIMTNDLILKRQLQLQTWRVPGQIAYATERTEITLVLACISSGECTPKQIASHLLFDDKARLNVAENLLKRAETLGLTESNRGKYELTEKGFKALKEKNTFIPEKGVFQLTYCNDSLLPSFIVEVKRFNEPSATEEAMHRSKDTTKKRLGNIHKFPDWILKETKGTEITPSLKGENFIIEALERKGEYVELPLQLHLEWNVSKQTLKLLKGKKVINQFPAPEVSLEDVWLKLLDQNGWYDEWNQQTSELEEFFDEIDESSRQSMRADILFEKPNIEGFGLFNNVETRGIKLRPKTDECAQQWACWRLLNFVTDYATQNKFSDWCQKARTPFNDFPIVLPNREELEAQLGQDSEARNKTSWHLITASDWNL
jgi:predicted transcriptional regulator